MDHSEEEPSQVGTPAPAVDEAHAQSIVDLDSADEEGEAENEDDQMEAAPAEAVLDLGARPSAGDGGSQADEAVGGDAAAVEPPAEAATANAAKAAPASRLMIHQIVLENFKSYGGRKVIGPFNKSFSAIVGPNGSGKSNTIDAMLFVFGKRAKKMRLNKVSELIHSSHEMPNPGSAKVEVTFQDITDTGDGAEDFEVVEGSQLTVGREAFRNNQSKYYVEGKPSNFTEVTQLLLTRGVDLEHNRFLILQGEVEQISLMKPKALSPHEEGLLEHIEEIIGSNRLQEPIDDATTVMEQLTEQRQEKLTRLRAAEHERDALDGPRREAEAWVSAEAEKLELQALTAQAEACRSHADLGRLEQEQSVLQGHMEGHRKKMEGFENEVKVIEQEHNVHLKDYNNIKARMEKSALDFKEFERQDVKFTEDIAFQEQKLVKLQESSAREKESAKKLLEDAEKLRNDAPLREQELESADRYRASLATKLEQIYEGLKGKAEELRPAKEAKEAELVPLQKQLTDVRKVVEVAQTEAQFIRDKTQQVANQIEDMKQQHDQCGKQLKVREQEGADAAKLKQDRDRLIKDAKGRLQRVTEQIEVVSQDVTTTRRKAEEARTEFEQEHRRGRLIGAVYEQSKSGGLQGVHGRLGDLGTIAKKYDVAVSTACSMLDAIVVNTTEDAQGVIEFIRRSDLGRTTCICLQKIKEREREMSMSVVTPEGAPRLVDLIKPAKPEYAVAFFFALQNTLVAENLEQATRIGLQGKKRWRVVTLQGQLIDTSGTMSGGGGHVMKGGMRASLCQFSPEEVKERVAVYEKTSAHLATIKTERRALEEALQLTEKELAEFDLREKTCNMDIASLKQQMETYDARLKTLAVPKLSADQKSKLKSLEKLVTERSVDMNKIQEKHQHLEEEVRTLHSQIMNIGGEELKTAKGKLEEATKKCEDMRRHIKKALLDAETMVKNSKRAEEKVHAAVGERAEIEKALKLLREEHRKLDDKAESVLNAYNELKDGLVQKDEVLTKLRAKRDEVIQAASALKSQEVDLVNELEEKTRVLRELHGKVTAWANKLQTVRKEYGQLPLDILEDLRAVKADFAKAVEEIADMGQELARRAIAADLEEADLRKVVPADVEARVLTLEANIKDLKPNLTSIQEFRRANAEHKLKLADYEAVHKQREEKRHELEGLKQTRLEEFMDGFTVISMKLKEIYQMITLGGDAELELVDTLDPFSEGISFSVRPPKKSWKQITNLSGGEKTLASLSLVFALHHYKPTPLYFMDEIDAALDFRNVCIIANYIKERTKNAQFIVISLRNHMFELADLLVGIYKTEDVSKSVSVTPGLFAEEEAAEAKPPQPALKDAAGTEPDQPDDAAGAGSQKRPAATDATPGNSKRRAVAGN